jgi:hypothetical protein
MFKKLSSTLILGFALFLILSGVFTGTLAFMSDTTDPVINTFTYGKIRISLNEPDDDNDGSVMENQYQIVAEQKIKKVPVVTVEKNSEDCWLFVEVIEKNNFSHYMTYSVFARSDNGQWIALPGTDNVYYREVDRSSSDVSFTILEELDSEGNTVYVKPSVTKEELNALEDFPKLEFKAYAVQRDLEIEELDTASDAWKLIRNELEK